MRIKGRETKWISNFKQYDVLLFMVPCIMLQFMKMTDKMQLCRIIYCSLTALHVLSDIFVHHQEHLNCIYSFWYYSRVSLPGDELNLDISRQQHTWIIPEAVNAVKMLLMMSENIAQNMQSSQGTINYPTQLHLVNHFHKIIWCLLATWNYNLMTETKHVFKTFDLISITETVASSRKFYKHVQIVSFCQIWMKQRLLVPQIGGVAI
jgi:hypothetical protein